MLRSVGFADRLDEGDPDYRPHKQNFRMGLSHFLISLMVLTVGILAPRAVTAQTSDVDCSIVSGDEKQHCSAALRFEGELRKSVSDRLAASAGEARRIFQEDQDGWSRTTAETCRAGAFSRFACLEALYSLRTSALQSADYGPLSFSCGKDRAAVFFNGAHDDTLSHVFGSGDCVLKDGVAVHVAKTPHVTSVWVDRRLVYRHEGGSVVRIEVDARAVRLCGPDFTTDRKNGDDCVPIANSRSDAPIDYEAFPPDPDAPRLGAIVVVYAEDMDFCRQFVADNELRLPGRYKPLAWEQAPQETFGVLSDRWVNDWLGAVQFDVDGNAYSFVQSVYTPYGLVARSTRERRADVVCRFAAAGQAL